jgi:hypothetical protein
MTEKDGAGRRTTEKTGPGPVKQGHRGAAAVGSRETFLPWAGNRPARRRTYSPAPRLEEQKEPLKGE